MKTSIFVLFLCALAALASPSSAAFIAYEPFGYSTGALLGQTNPSNGMSWLRAGVSTGPTAINVVSGNLTVPLGIGDPSGNSIAITGIGENSGSTVRLPLGQLVNSG
jgi:hypothetical protein